MNQKHLRRWLLPLGLSALFALGSCAAPQPAENKSLTPMEELPESYSVAWLAWRNNTPEWGAWRERIQADVGLAGFFVDNLTRVMIRTYEHSAIARAGEKAGPFERATRELVFLQEHSAPVMLELLMVGDTIVSFLAGDVLVRIDEGRWSLALAQKLTAESAEERRRALEWLAKLPLAGDQEDQVWALMTPALKDSQWAVRVEAVTALGQRCLARGRIDLARPLLSRALSDPDDQVVKAACAALAANQDRASVPALINLLTRLERGEDLRAMKAVQEALQAVTGEKQLQTSNGWRRWWSKNRS